MESVFRSRTPNPSHMPSCAKNTRRPDTSRRKGWLKSVRISSRLGDRRTCARRRKGGLTSRPTAFAASSYAGSPVALRAPRRDTSSPSPMQAIPQPSGWPAFGSGCGQPKSLGVRPDSARTRNASRRLGGNGRSLTAPRIRDMSLQLVPDLPEELPPGLSVRLRLDALRPLPVDHADDPASPRVVRDEHVHGVRRRAEDRDDLGGVSNRSQDIDRVRVLQEDDERVARPDRKSVPGREVLQGGVVPLHPNEAWPARLAERDPKPRLGDRVNNRFVQVLCRLDEMGLPDNHVQVFGVLDGHALDSDHGPSNPVTGSKPSPPGRLDSTRYGR